MQTASFSQCGTGRLQAYLVQGLLCLIMHQIAPKMQYSETEN